MQWRRWIGGRSSIKQTLNEIDAAIQDLSVGNQKCDNADDSDDAAAADADDNADGDMIPMCRPCLLIWHVMAYESDCSKSSETQW